ncbi:hypothetical protein JMJ56_32910 [Belnapia sp. T18]|uniref:Uncharacterized protein n=1 Tax=Belnapia arida TaxID=2804533 RepID=A0ABS1UDI2_9PROT|nr:hypothetical protein [Belnapia arida]MBL6082757.1 hypothetical protein [Belnapia arida]
MSDPANQCPGKREKRLPRIPAQIDQTFAAIVFAALCGFALVGLALFGTAWHAAHFRWPILVVGLATILGALGAQVVVRYKWLAASGAAACVILLAQIFRPEVPFVYGHLHGTENVPQVTVRGQTFFLAGKVSQDLHWQFFARSEWLTGDTFSIRFVEPSQAPSSSSVVSPPSTATPRPIIIGCIPMTVLRERVLDPAGADLTLRRVEEAENDGEWRLYQAGRISNQPIGHFGNPECPVTRTSLGAKTSPVRFAWPRLFSLAFAQTDRGDAADLFRNLATTNLDIQTRALSDISHLRDPARISAIVSAWQPGAADLNVEGALLVAWVGSIRQDRSTAVSIGSSLSPEQLSRIVDLMGSSDLTVRRNATELLSWLLQSGSWPAGLRGERYASVVGAVLAPFVDPSAYDTTHEQTNKGNVRFNALVALQDARCDLPVPTRGEVDAALSAFAGTTYATSGTLPRVLASIARFRGMACPTR